MKAEEKKIFHFLGSPDRNFIIPVYQRNYDWKIEQCNQLFNDLIDIKNSNFRTHFLGTIVAYNDDGYGEEYLIIDGQQRLTTISLLLLAIYKLLEEGYIKSENVNKDKIYKTYLTNEFSNEKKKIKLKPIKDDRDAFEGIFTGEINENSNITVNFYYFKERILKNEVSIDDLYRAIEKLIIVEILLKKGEDDPQLIFESLNSTGLDLSEADKARNFILMKQTSEKQEELYNNYWAKIEKNTDFKVSEFLRDYLAYKRRIISNKSQVYLDFKEYFIKNNLEIEDLLKDLLKFSNYYKKIIFSNDENKEISKIFKNINKLEVVVMYPFLLELYNDKKNGFFDENIFTEILKILESYVFRRFICEIPTNSLNKTFLILGKEIKNFSDYKENYFEIFKYILLNKTSYQRFPKDDEFKKYLSIKDIYNIQSKNKNYLLEKLESFGNKESYIGEMIKNGDLTIEHIMPQILTSEWKKELGENYKEIHQKYLHTLGNLTFTGYNSKYSNNSFKNKKEIEKGFNESPLFLNIFIKSCENWSEKEILERYKILENKSLKIWTFPETNYTPEIEVETILTFSDCLEKDMAGTNIRGFSFIGEKYESISSFADLYEIIVKILYEKDPLKMKSFLENSDYGIFSYTEEKELKNSRKIDNNLYLNTRNSTNKKLFRIKLIFEKYGIDYDELEIYKI